ncbi:MAG TPA: M28 family peptidase [Blastocatellia bacterium]|nr:M28 family peptidase [Blastocatellia bacterium]
MRRLKPKSIPSIAFCCGFVLFAGCQERTASVAPVDVGNRGVAASGESKLPETDASRAFEHVRKLVDLGPHPSGSPAIKKAQDYLGNELKSYGLKVTEDNFTGETPRGPIPMKNLIAELPGSRPDIVIIAGHYDTKQLGGFVGANDGGSSAAAVLEMARVLAPTKQDATLWFVLFDGEEAVIEWEGTDNTYGSRHLAAKLTADGSLKRIKAMILVDMIGDENLDLMIDGGSTRWLVDIVWRKAREIGHGRHFLGNESGYSDDHIPFVERGIPAIDLIDFNYGPGNSYWHTAQDTLDKVSGESIKVVCDVVIHSLPEVIKRVLQQAPPPAQRGPQ